VKNKRVDDAIEKIVEIFEDHLSTLTPAQAKAMLKSLKKLANKVSRRKKR
jgi:hypothetical protein